MSTKRTPTNKNGLTFEYWLNMAGFELNSPTMWPEDYEALQEEWVAGVDPTEYMTSPFRRRYK